jgi:hypothetical protein
MDNGQDAVPPTPPSALRVPVTLLLVPLAPPLALAAWVLLSGSHRATYLRSGWVRAGGATVVVAALPLLAIIVLAQVGLWPDPNPNPVGPGLFFFAGGALGLVCALVGVLKVALAKQQS